MRERERERGLLFTGGPGDMPSILGVQPVVFPESDELWLVYTGGCDTPPEGSKASHVLSLCAVKKNTYTCTPLIPFQSRVANFLYLPTDTKERCQTFC